MHVIKGIIFPALPSFCVGLLPTTRCSVIICAIILAIKYLNLLTEMFCMYMYCWLKLHYCPSQRSLINWSVYVFNIFLMNAKYNNIWSSSFTAITVAVWEFNVTLWLMLTASYNDTKNLFRLRFLWLMSTDLTATWCRKHFPCYRTILSLGFTFVKINWYWNQPHGPQGECNTLTIKSIRSFLQLLKGHHTKCSYTLIEPCIAPL